MAKSKSGSEKAKATRAASWARGEDRKKIRREKQETAHRRNVTTVKTGGTTPWQAAKAARIARRAAARAAQPGGQS